MKKKSVRSIVVVTLFSLMVVNALSAETMGTNPKPKPAPGKNSSVVEMLEYAVLSYLGL